MANIANLIMKRDYYQDSKISIVAVIGDHYSEIPNIGIYHSVIIIDFLRTDFPDESYVVLNKVENVYYVINSTGLKIGEYFITNYPIVSIYS